MNSPQLCRKVDQHQIKAHSSFTCSKLERVGENDTLQDTSVPPQHCCQAAEDIWFVLSC